MSGEQTATDEVIQAAFTPRVINGDTFVQFVEPGDGETDCPLVLNSNSDRTVQLLERTDLVASAPQYCRIPPQWWLLDVYVFNLQTVSLAVLAQDVPAWNAVKTSGGRCSGAKLIIAQQGDEVRLDVGRGGRYSIFSNNVTVKLEYPAPAMLRGNNSLGGAFGIRDIVQSLSLSNTIVMATLRSSAGPIGSRAGQVTCSVNVPGGLNAPGLFVPIPNRATHVTVYEDTPATPGPSLNFVGRINTTLATSVDRGEITFPAAGVEVPTPRIPIPGNACFIATSTDARQLTFVFDVDF
jgi:hypothetical protein